MAEAFFEREDGHPRRFILHIHLSKIAASGNVFGIHHDAVFHFVQSEPRRIHAAVVIRKRVMNVGASGCCHLERILKRFHGILVIAEFFIDFSKAVPSVHAVRVQCQSTFEMLLCKRPIAPLHVTFRKSKMDVIRFCSEFNGAVVSGNGIARRFSEIVQIAKEHPGLHEIRK